MFFLLVWQSFLGRPRSLFLGGDPWLHLDFSLPAADVAKEGPGDFLNGAEDGLIDGAEDRLIPDETEDALFPDEMFLVFGRAPDLFPSSLFASASTERAGEQFEDVGTEEIFDEFLAEIEDCELFSDETEDIFKDSDKGWTEELPDL